MKYPRSTFFILTGSFFEKFGYFGIRTILPLYFVDVLLYNENTSTILYHTYSMCIYIFSLLGASIADSWLGKYRTIVSFGMFYVMGLLLLSASSVPTLGLPVKEISILSLLLIALGSGSIKPVLAAIGGDQFKLPEQEAHLKSYFFVFYFFINAGSLMGILVIPIIRKDITCYGKNACYPMATLSTAVLTIIFVVILLAGKKLYNRKKPEGNVIAKVTKCVYYAITHRRISPNRKSGHWLDNADDKFEPRLISDIKYALNVLKLFIPVPLFWALYHQQGSRWTFQATRMDGEVFGYLIKPDQFQVVNSVLIAVFLPLFHFCMNPVMEKFLLINTSLRKMIVGGLIASLAFVVSGLLELKLEATYPIAPSSGLAQVRIFNEINCNAIIYFGQREYNLGALDFYQNLSIPANGSVNLKVQVHYQDCPYTAVPNSTVEKSLQIDEAKTSSWIMTKDGINSKYQDLIEKSRSGDPKIRALIYTDNDSSPNISLKLSSGKANYLINATSNEFTNFTTINHNKYSVSINEEIVMENLVLKFGGVYNLVGHVSNTHQVTNLVTLAESNSIHMFWLLPQYVAISVAEIMFSVTGLEFAYSQAPASMKSLIIACWCLTIAFGDIIIIMIAKLQFFDRQVHEFFLFAALMFVDVMIFAIMTRFYRYADFTQNENLASDVINLQATKLLSID